MTTKEEILCISRGKGVKPGVKAVENPQQSLKQIRISEDLASLHEDLIELNQILNIAQRSAERDATQTEIHQTTAKIDSLHSQQNPTPENSSTQLLWSEVVGKKKKIVPATQPVTYNIPVSINCYNMPSHDEGYIKNSVINQSHVVQS